MPAQSFISKFYLIINPGLEDLALAELKANLAELENPKKHLGGIEFECDIFKGLELNAKLKIPSRILMRIEEFAASDFPKLFKKLQRVSWQEMLWPQTPLRFEVSTEESRLSIKKRIASTAEDAIKKYFTSIKPDQSIAEIKAPKNLTEQRVFLRIVKNICTLSIDTSGEHLHKRGYRKLIGEAPLRENLASALLNSLFDHAKNLDAQSYELVDPMMGSGTFLLEAFHYFSGSQLRDYAFEAWPFVLKAHLENSDAVVVPGEIAKIRSLNGFDQDDESVRITKENFQSLVPGKSKGLSPKFEFQAEPQFEMQQKDVFQLEVLAQTSEFTRILICNPPYGKRIKVEGKITDFYTRLFQVCADKVKPKFAGFLISDEVSENQIHFPKTWTLIEQLKFKNGGLKVRFLIFKDSNPT